MSVSKRPARLETNTRGAVFLFASNWLANQVG